MEVKKIVILGNSVALRNRPHTKEQSLNYGQLISKALNTEESKTLYLVENIAFGRATMTDLHIVSDKIINSFADYYIINIGVSDAATREMSKWFADVLNRRKQSFIVKIFKLIFSVFHKPLRTVLVRLRGKRSWTSAKKFDKLFRDLIYKIQHNTSGKIIVLPLLIGDDRIERIVPGTNKNYAKFNNILELVSIDKEIELLNLDSLKSEVDYPDGTHLSEEGNVKVAQEILKVIKFN